MLNLWWLFLFCPIAYLFGNMNFSIILSKYVLKSDIRKIGSGNPGASNILRNFGFRWGLLTLILENIKCAIPTVMGMLVFGGLHYHWTFFGAVSSPAGQIGMFACGLSAIIGNIFPVFLKFHGGKGVATTVGMFLIANPLLTVLMVLLGILIAHIGGYAIISSFTMATTLLIFECFVKSPPTPAIVLIFIGYALLFYTHRKNIIRLLSGRENRVTVFKKKSSNPPVQ